MDYIYDIMLNLQNEYYDFYEWQLNDKIINVKRLPIYKISTKSYLNIKNNDTTISRSTLPKHNKLFLLTSGIEVMGILIDNLGKVIKKSSLLSDESDDILEDKNLIKEINIKYTIKKTKTITFISRQEKEKRQYLNDYFNKIDKIKDEYFLKYLYFDITNDNESDIDKVYHNLQSLTKENPTKMFDNIKKVELELKR